MGKNGRLRFPRGHGWGFGRATQTHRDRRHKRQRTRGARLRAALEGSRVATAAMPRLEEEA